MLQLAHVAGPVVGQQGALGVGRQAQAAQPQARAVEFEEMPGQHQHVATALAQRRDVHGVDRQPVVEVGAKAPGAHLFPQPPVGRGDHPHVDVARLVGAQALDLAVLQSAQQLGLDRQRQLADLVEEQRAAVGRLETPWPRLPGAGEGTLGVAEQLALGQGLGQRRAVHVDQRLARTRRMAVQPAGEQLLAHPGLALQQHRQVGVGDHRQLVEQLAQHRTVAEDHARRLVAGGHRLTARQAQAAYLVLQAADAQRRLDQHGVALQARRRAAVEAAVAQRIEGHRAPQLAVQVEAHAHAVVHRQRLVRAVFQQAVVGVGQLAVGGELDRLAARQDLRQARVAGKREAAAEHLVGQADGGLRAQAVAVQTQQHHGAAGEDFTQADHQALQAHRTGQFAGQVGQQGILQRGEIYHFGYQIP
ncbi:hypothetical protein D9M69_418610 [compost metagenome]